MKHRFSITFASVAMFLFAGFTPGSLPAAELVHAKDGSGVYGYNDTPILPWCGYRVHDADRPAPKRVDPGPAPTTLAPAPADAIVLFNGKDLSQWEPTNWKLVDGCIEAAGGGDLTTKQQFKNFQLHLEWKATNPRAARGTIAAITAYS